MKYNFKNGALISFEKCCFLEVYSIIPDEDTAELNDINGFVIGIANIEELNNCCYIEYDDNNHLTGIVKELKNYSK